MSEIVFWLFLFVVLATKTINNNRISSNMNLYISDTMKSESPEDSESSTKTHSTEFESINNLEMYKDPFIVKALTTEKPKSKKKWCDSLHRFGKKNKYKYKRPYYKCITFHEIGLHEIRLGCVVFKINFSMTEIHIITIGNTWIIKKTQELQKDWFCIEFDNSEKKVKTSFYYSIFSGSQYLFGKLDDGSDNFWCIEVRSDHTLSDKNCKNTEYMCEYMIHLTKKQYGMYDPKTNKIVFELNSNKCRFSVDICNDANDKSTSFCFSKYLTNNEFGHYLNLKIGKDNTTIRTQFFELVFNTKSDLYDCIYKTENIPSKITEKTGNFFDNQVSNV
ncbi:hypothetical protein EDEG_02935 [Edhazardia aedis USNM 41457]|uniref:Uncharacterized protein n=1 Tax=Edhazardia aedis (strain USNM 41457) TaxID=1003232 RepID=J9D561_EDHAE|nr:hypothetical protein EDEG_02935 [Edhazardia aedis USNM 41457]|eukprot:EJW02664.1 hypothetical protein EDEG_02935 [Edhazardia aedis USNM 41457]